MDKQFTASEVRDAITWKYGDKLTRISAMLNAFADMLEAQEKAVAASVTDAMVERASRVLCQSGKFETGQGTCALICMGKLGVARQGGCSCEVRVHGELVRKVLEAALAAQENPNG